MKSDCVRGFRQRAIIFVENPRNQDDARLSQDLARG